MLSIILSEIQNALKRSSRVELRNVFTLETRLQKEGFRRNPKNGEKIFVNQKKNIRFKLSREWAKKINDKT